MPCRTPGELRRVSSEPGHCLSPSTMSQEWPEASSEKCLVSSEGQGDRNHPVPNKGACQPRAWAPVY